MSLTDALLNEGYRDPRSVYIALRSDQQRGSGTLNDPYNGGTGLGPEMAASLSFKAKEFVVGFNFNHNLLEDDIVYFENVQGVASTWFTHDPSAEVPNVRLFKVKEKLSDLCILLSFDYLHGGGSLDAPPGPPAVLFSWNGLIRAFQTDGSNDFVDLNDPPDGPHNDCHIYWPVVRVGVPDNHGLSHLDGVTISAISLPALADLAGEYPILGGDPTIVGLAPRARQFFFRLNSRPALPSDFPAPGDPDVSCTVRRHIYRFDDVMKTVPTYSVIHLGPGIFTTRGTAGIHLADPSDYTLFHAGFVLREGHRLLGAGIDVTVIKLVLPLDEINQTAAIGCYPSPVADYAEVSELTVDCHAPGHVAPYGTFPAPVTCGAVELTGNFIRVSRVRAINFCVQARAECFVIALAGGSNGTPRFNVIEDCIVEKPGENNTHETTLITVFGDTVSGGAVSPIVRHNYHDCAFAKRGLERVPGIDALLGRA